MLKTHFSIIIPAYNESQRIVSTLTSVIGFFSKKEKSFEIIIVDDGSSDNLYSVLTPWQYDESPVRLEAYPENRGKGFAVKHGVTLAKGENILFLDADGATPIEEFEKLYSAIQEGYDIAIGSRACDTTSVQLKAKWYRILLGRIFNFFVNILCVPHVKDTQCGFKLFSRKAVDIVFSRQTIEGFAFDCELLHIAYKHGLSIKEVAVNWYNVEGSRVNLLIDPLYMFFEVLKIRYRSLVGQYR